MKKVTFLSMVFLIFLYSNINVSAQKWKEIIPSVSTCEDVKRIFEVKECEFPTSRYKFPKYNISITFSDGKNIWNVPEGRVAEVTVILQEPIRLELYEADLTDYKIIPEDDLPNQKIYENDKQGIELTVQDYKNEGLWIYAIFLYPSKENREKFKCKP